VISKRWLFAACASAVLATGVAACGSDDSSDSSSDATAASSDSTATDLSGKITIDGSSTVQPFAEAAAELFNEQNPDVDITVGAAGTSGGFEKFCAGETDISDASRPIEPEEVDACKKGGVAYHDFQVANDGIAVVTNPALEITCLSVDQLKQLWANSDVTNYSQLGNDADSNQPLPDAEVSLYGPGTDSGTFDYFTDVINGEEDVSRKDYQPSEDDNVLVQGVAGDQNGMGYFGFSYYEQNQDQLNLVSVDDGKGCTAPSSDTIQGGSYSPLSRPLFMYPSDEALQRPEVSGFVQFVADNYQQIAEASLIVPMDSSQASKAQADVQKAVG
jgi:phosphate transport system substrate-binding protein